VFIVAGRALFVEGLCSLVLGQFPAGLSLWEILVFIVVVRR